MDTTQTIYFLLGTLVVMIPQLIVLIIGIILSLMNLQKTPKASKIALAGLGIMLLLEFVGLGVTFIQINLPLWYRDSYTMIAYFNTTVRFVLNIVWAAGLGMLIYAVWSGRDQK